MGLTSIVYAAKKNTPAAVKFDPTKPLTNFIDATAGTIRRDENHNITVAEEKPFNWKECTSLKKAGERCYCQRFFSMCAQEKCKGKFPVPE